MTYRSLAYPCISALVSLLACGPGKDPGETDTDPTSGTGTPNTDPTSSSDTTTAPTGTTAGPTTGEPLPSTSTSTSTAAEPDPTSTTSEPLPSTSTSSETDGSSSTTEPALGPCEERLTEEDCLATTLGGHNTCAWQPEFALWSERAGCGTFAGPPRCLPVHYTGDGCNSDCPSPLWVYFRELEDGTVELMDYAGCGLVPDGWKQCQGAPDQDPPACACFC